MVRVVDSVGDGWNWKVAFCAQAAGAREVAAASAILRRILEGGGGSQLNQWRCVFRWRTVPDLLRRMKRDSD